MTLTPAEQAEHDYADEIATDLVDDVFSRTDDWRDRANVAFCVFIWMIHHLIEIGWTEEQLHGELRTHFALHYGKPIPGKLS